MALEKTLVILKPDAVGRRLAGKIIGRFEEKGLRLSAMRLTRISMAAAEKHYAEHAGKPFYPGLTAFITSGPVVLMALEGREAVAVVRRMIGKTNGREAEPGSVRGDFGVSRGFNLVHASDSVASAERELALFFKDEDFIPTPEREELRWNYEFGEGGPD